MKHNSKGEQILNKLEELGKDLKLKIKSGTYNNKHKKTEPCNDIPIFLIGIDDNISQNKRIIKITKQFFSQFEFPVIVFFNSKNESNLKLKINLFIENNIKYFLQDNEGKSSDNENPMREDNISLSNISSELNKLLIDYCNSLCSNNNKKNIETSQPIYALGSKKPESLMLDLVLSNKNYIAIRGSFSSSIFLKTLHAKLNDTLNEKIDFQRIALLETAKGYQFFYAPVGIDEVKTLDRKFNFIRNYAVIFNLLKTSNRISILSGGRLGDLGRDPIIDTSIVDAEELVKKFKTELHNNPENEVIKVGEQIINLDFNKLNVVHDEILIEKSVLERSGFILAPTGMSGNLIYRTLVHLGAGNAYGALYTNIFLKTNKVIIDCSRVAKESELLGSFIIGLGFYSLCFKE